MHSRHQESRYMLNGSIDQRLRQVNMESLPNLATNLSVSRDSTEEQDPHHIYQEILTPPSVYLSLEEIRSSRNSSGKTFANMLTSIKRTKK